MRGNSWKFGAAETNHDQSFQESTRKLAAENSDINDEDDSNWPHNLRTSRAYVPHLEEVYSNLRQQLYRARRQNGRARCEYVEMGMFMTVTLQAAVHLRKDYLENLRSTQKSATKNSETNGSGSESTV